MNFQRNTDMTKFEICLLYTSILFSNLVKDLLGLDAVLLDYPNHIASAVRFNEDISGDYILLDGKKYLICDPTYIGAPIGMCMDRFKSVPPEIIR